MEDLNSVRENLDQAVASLDDLRVAMREGDPVDLDAFNLMVAKTCRAAVELPQADAPKVRPQLERLLSGLNEVKADIEAEQNEINERLSELGGAESGAEDGVAEGAEDGAINGAMNGIGAKLPTDD
ncbi:MAG: hypothetical protein HKN28_02205 [Alphaproteobacteria bacterium]|nr:hypothetical protein [Alphaproteobacteria bacterium]